MILRGARVALGPTATKRLDVEIRRGRIAALKPSEKGSIAGRDAIDLAGHLILPGLINAHDHLSFNLFPLLGHPPYSNATEWARDVYRPGESPILEHRSLSRKTRLAWGAIKNLISGVTTVAHHDPDPPSLFTRGFPVAVAKMCWAHSLEFTPDVVLRFRKTPRDQPFILHLGEATDGSGDRELQQLDRLGLLSDRTVIVHGVDLTTRALQLLKQRRASLIACPVSNLFTLRRTLPRSVFATGIPIALGTDSAITATGDLLDHLRAARAIWNLSAARLYRMVTTDAAQILRLRDGQGEVREGGVADLLIVSDAGASPASTLLDLHAPQFVMVRGEIRLARKPMHSLQPITVHGRGRAFIDAPVADLYRETASGLGTDFKLAGRRLRIDTIR